MIPGRISGPGQLSCCAVLPHIGHMWTKCPGAVAELAICRQLGINQLEELENESISWSAIRDALNYAKDICNRPTRNTSGERASQADLEILRNILAACGQWKFTRDVNFEEHFEMVTGIRPDQIMELSMGPQER